MADSGFKDTNIPAISVAMSVYNNEDYLALAIDSILAQDFRDFEFLILNDGSTDGSAAIIESYAAKDNRVRAIHRDNKGLVFSLNQMLEESRAPLIARMDGDDIADPTRLSKQMNFIQKHPEYGVVGTWTTDIDETGNRFYLTGEDQPTTHDGFVAAIGKQQIMCHPSVLMRRDLVLSVGGYHGAFKHCEDYDLWLRMCSITKLCSLPERLIHYRHSEGQVSNKHVVEQQIGAAISYYAYKEREAGRPDPTTNLETLPPLSQVNDLFGSADAEQIIREKVVPALIYSPRALRTEGFGYIVDFVKSGGNYDKLWRTIGRLVTLGEYRRAAYMAYAMTRYSR